MSVITNNLLLGDDGYNISRSVRLRSSASAYFNRTPASAGNRKTWTFSTWLKRGKLGADQDLLSYYTSGLSETIRIGSDDKLYRYCVDTSGTVNRVLLNTNAVLRDPSAWYHIVMAQDTTQATDTNRVKIYINGVQQSITATVWPALNWDGYINSVLSHSLGGTQGYTDGYLTEINFIDGQALTPSSFGETNVLTGVWKPKKYTGTYGTNGFYLNFKDPSSTTTIGYDYSGNSNNWTSNNISVTSGVTYDSMIDVPTVYADGGNGRGNYATLNPLFGGGLSNGNLTTTANSLATMSMTGGKYYWEVQVTSSNGYTGVGFTDGVYTKYLRWNVAGGGWTASNVTVNISSQTGQSNCVIMCAFDDAAGKFWIGVNGTWFSSGDPSTGANPAVSFTAAATGNWFPEDNLNAGGSCDYNFGQRPFTYTPPTGFKALNTQNLPDATIKKGNAYFDATLYTGNGTSQSIVNSGGFQPDLVWAKQRNGAANHRQIDSVRGASQVLFSSLTNAEVTDAAGLTSFNSNGFSVGTNQINDNAATMVAWQWKESASAGFDIVTYTGDGTSSRNISHSLGVVPSMVIVKCRSSAYIWPVKHKSLASNNNVFLEQTTATTNVVSGTGSGGLGDLSSSTTFSVVAGTTNSNNTNQSAQTYVAYLFAEVAGFSKFGSYTGNGSTDGPFVYCGFRPRYVLFKRTDTLSQWSVHDTARDTYNAVNLTLLPNASDAEASSNKLMDITANGFKFRDTNADANASGGTYIFAAFAENPFKNSLAR